VDPGPELPAPAKTQKMNLFYLEEKEEDCASSHCNKHVPKMVVETAQLLCNVSHARQTFSRTLLLDSS